MKSYQKLLLANEAWVQKKLSLRSDFFTSSAGEQTPEFLWIGCSDSRVPAEDITGAEPGELFVHRNIANLVIHTDLNVLSVIQYAVEALQVRHVIVCGHYNCGGIRNAMSHQDLGLINTWLRNIKDVYHAHRTELEAIADTQDRYDRLVELNVIEQVQHIAETSLVQKVWHAEHRPMLHGWVYDLRTGYIKELVRLTPESQIGSVYRFNYDGSA